MVVVDIDPQTDPRWRRLLDQHCSSVFHSPPWMRALSTTYSFDIRALVMLDEAGQPRAGLPFCRVADVRGERIVSLPFSDYCDPIVADLDEWYELTEPLVENCLPIALRTLHNPVPLDDERFALNSRAKWHRLDLKPDIDHLWAGLHEAGRRAIRKAQRAGAFVRPAEREEDLRAFFEMHLRIRKYKYYLLAQPYSFFEHIWRAFDTPENEYGVVLLFATDGHDLVGGTLFLGWKDTLYYKFNASQQGSLAVRPNDLIIWEAIQYAKTHGYRYLDFGLSDWDQDGLVQFKRKYSTEEKTISFLKYVPNNLPDSNGSDLQGLLTSITDLLTDPAVPDDVTERAGSTLYRLFV